MKNGDRPIQEGVGYRLSGVVCVPSQQPNFDVQQKWIISSFAETRFQNVLKRARILPKTSWFWHHKNKTQLCEKALAIISVTANDYIQALTKRYQLTNALIELDPQAELLLLISPELDFVFGTVLETGEMFSTHILFREKGAERQLSNFSGVSTKLVTPLPDTTRVLITPRGVS
ncbi:hypothetical protein WKK05_37710 (plasmid) [Nostoc sp. UHCC 0302]|uniref:hypothetical protein n=1 Tax=Nostoc sp. UHCC 0302 TaxID=3134896 RepID=UPI00311CDAFC